MFGIRFIKASQASHLFHFQNGKTKRQGVGLSFFYYSPTSSLAMVPVANAEIPFVFHETTADFQEITIQGQLSYRVAQATELAKLLDFSVDGKGRALGDGAEVLQQRLVHAVQVRARSIIERMQLKEALLGSDGISSAIWDKMQTDPAVTMLGIQVLGLNLLSLRPAPEMGRALEAGAREELQRIADAALYDRRYAAVEEERKIKENELNTDIAVEEKKRLIREKQVAADIAIESQRAELVEQKVENDRKSADSRAYALTAQIAPLRDLNWKTLMALSGNGGEAQQMIAMAFRELAENADKIGVLNISPDLLESLVAAKT